MERVSLATEGVLLSCTWHGHVLTHVTALYLEVQLLATPKSNTNESIWSSLAKCSSTHTSAIRVWDQNLFIQVNSSNKAWRIAIQPSIASCSLPKFQVPPACKWRWITTCYKALLSKYLNWVLQWERLESQSPERSAMDAFAKVTPLHVHLNNSWQENY